MKLHIIISIFIFSFIATSTEVIWKNIQEAIMQPDKNHFSSSGFVIEKFNFVPPPKQVEENSIPLEYFAMTSLIGFQATEKGVFNFFNCGKTLLNFYSPETQLEIKKIFATYKIEAQLEYDKYSKNKSGIILDQQLFAYWLYAQNSNILKAMLDFYSKFGIEPKKNYPQQSTDEVAELILQLGLPFYVINDSQIFICLGFFSLNKEKMFCMIDLKQQKEPFVFSFFDNFETTKNIIIFKPWNPEWKIFYQPLIQLEKEPNLLLKNINLNK